MVEHATEFAPRMTHHPSLRALADSWRSVSAPAAMRAVVLAPSYSSVGRFHARPMLIVRGADGGARRRCERL
jgi:hypothetical protein